MITMIYAWIDGVMGMEITLICYGICVLLYFALCFLLPANRCGKRKVLYGWLVCEGICDLLWYFCYFEDGHYVNRGMAGSVACILLPIFLVIAGMVVTVCNEGKSDS